MAKHSYANLGPVAKALYDRVVAWFKKVCISPQRPTMSVTDQMKPIEKDGVLIYRPFHSEVEVHVDPAKKTVRTHMWMDNMLFKVEGERRKLELKEFNAPTSDDLFRVGHDSNNVTRMNALTFPKRYREDIYLSEQATAQLVGDVSFKERKLLAKMARIYCLSNSPLKMGKIVSGYFYKRVLDPRITSILYSVAWFKWSIKDYENVWQHLDAVEEAMRIAPGVVLPWIKLMGRKDFGQPRGPIPDMLHWFEKYGLKKAQWKWLIHAHKRTFLCGHVTPGKILLLSDPNVKLPFTLLMRLGSRDIFGADRVMGLERAYLGAAAEPVGPATIPPYLVPMYKALSKAAPKKDVRLWCQRIVNELPLVLEAFAGVFGNDYPAVVYDHARMRDASWATWMRAQREWHETLRARQDEFYAARRQQTRLESWESKLTHIESDDLVAVALTTGLALEEEGREMHHCVEGYQNKCLIGMSRIFSIRDKKGERVSTLEIAPPPSDDLVPGMDPRAGRWIAVQNRGVCNEQVSSKVEAFGKFVAQEYSK